MHKELTVKEVQHEFDRPTNGYSQALTSTLINKISIVADLLTIKMNNLHPWYETKKAVSGGVATEILYSRYVDVGTTLVLTHVSAIISTNVPTTIEIAIERGGELIVLNRDVPSAADISVDWDGQAMLIEHDRVKVTYRGSTSADKQDVSMSGYKIKS